MLSVLRVRGMLAVMASAAAAFAGFGLLLPVIPLVLSQHGASEALAGSVTAAFMATTVATQIVAPKALRAFGHVPVLAAGCLALGPPSLLLIVVVEHPVAVLAVSAVRGVGFGLLTVASAALIAEIMPRELLGRASGLQGIAVGLAQLLTLPLGLVITDRFGEALTIWLGALIPTLATPFLLRLRRAGAGSKGDAPAPTAPLALAPVFVPFAAMLGSAIANGAVTSLSPIAFESTVVSAAVIVALVSAAIMAGRYGAGTLSDRLGPRKLLGPGIGVCAVGLAGMVASLQVDALSALAYLGAFLFGLGFGAVQNDALVSLFAAVGPQRAGLGSALWNAGFDTGTGLGSLTLGAVATAAGFSAMFSVGAAILIAVPMLAIPLAAATAAKRP